MPPQTTNVFTSRNVFLFFFRYVHKIQIGPNRFHKVQDLKDLKGIINASLPIYSVPCSPLWRQLIGPVSYFFPEIFWKWSGSVVSDSLQPHGLCSPPGSSVRGIFQARILESVAIRQVQIFTRVLFFVPFNTSDYLLYILFCALIPTLPY